MIIEVTRQLMITRMNLGKWQAQRLWYMIQH